MKSIPSGWNKTLEDLRRDAKAGLRPHLISADEVAWAVKYEKSLLSPTTRFPRNGEVYEAIQDTVVTYLTQWRAPYTGSGEGIIKAGERISVFTIEPEPVGVNAAPLDMAGFAARNISEAERSSPKFSGFVLFIKTAQVNRDFHLVSDKPVA
jgi:hypothetical protein